MTRALDTVVVRPHRRPEATRSLVCLGFCGGGTGPYHGWGSLLPDEVELAAICYPGREGRFAHDRPADWAGLAADATEAVRAAADRPYVLFGHSMGGWMAFDVVTRLAAAGGPLPEALVVSSCNAPGPELAERDRFPSMADTDDQLLDWMGGNGFLPEYVLADEDLREMALDLMRGDIAVRDTYAGTAGTRVDVPVHLLSGADDPVIAEDAPARWRELTGGGFRHRVLPGGHFYTPRVWAELPAYFA